MKKSNKSNEKNMNRKSNDKLYNLYNLYKLNKRGGVPRQQQRPLSQGEIEYYSDFMKIKSDATAILHQQKEPSFFFKMCQYLTIELYQKENVIFRYIHDVLVPDMFLSQNNYDKLQNFIKNSTYEYESYLAVFTRVTNNANRMPEDIEKYLSLFYKFYLKGGSAMKAMYNLYKSEIIKRSINTNLNTFLTPDEENNFLGKNSDYDFDFLINELIPEDHYNRLLTISSEAIIQLLLNIVEINSSTLFNNKQFITNYIERLKRNEPYGLHALNPYKYPIKFIMKGMINDTPRELENDTSINKIGYVTCSKLDFDNTFEEKGKESVRFNLLRLFIKLKNEINIDGRYNNIYAEIIDVGIPQYNSYDRKTKWNKSISNLKIDGVYCYNLNSIVKDLEFVIEETEQSGDLNKIAKLDKRRNRLLFFKNLICVIPRLLHGEYTSQLTGIGQGDYENMCDEIISKICPDSKIVGKLKKKMDSSLIGIYNNFPETVNPDNLNIFSIIKQYFHYELLDSITERHENYYKVCDTPTLNEIKRHSYSSDNIDEIYSNGYYIIIEPTATPIGTIYVHKKINILIFEKICNLVDELYKKFGDVEDMKKMLCTLLLNYSKFMMYFNNYSLYNESTFLFISTLMDIGHKLLNGEIVEISKQSLNISIINHRKILQSILNKNKAINRYLIDALQYPFMKISLHIKDITGSKIYLRGSYAYNFHRILRNNDKTEYLNFNDIDIFIMVGSQDYDQQESTETWFEKKIIYICDTYNVYFKNLFEENKLYHDGEIYSIVSYLIKMDGIYLYQMVLNRYLPCSSSEATNSTFNYIFRQIEGNENSYRVVNHHIFEVLITHNVDYINDSYYSSMNEIVNDSYLKPNLIKNTHIIDNYLNTIRQNNGFNNKYDAEINKNNINVNDFYIQNIEGITMDYNNIILEDSDILRKNIYIERLMNLSTNNL